MRSLVALLLVAGCAPPRASFDSTLPPPTPVVAFPFERYNDHLYVRALVNKDSAWLLLDTGTAYTWVDSAWAMRAGATPVPGGRNTVMTVSLDSVVLGGFQLRKHRALLISTAFISQGSGRAIRGILGFEGLRRYTIEIDPLEGLIKLYDPATYRYAGSGTVVPIALRDGLLFTRAQVSVAGRRPVTVHLMLDTGASRQCTIFSRHFLATHKEFDALPGLDAIVGVGINGQFEGRVMRLQELRLGPFVARAPTVGLPDSGTEKILDFPADGVIGNQLLTRTGIVFDYARHRIILAKAGTDESTCPYDMSGLFLTTSGPLLEEVRVAHITPNSPASDAGVRLGDAVVAVDGKPIAALTLWEIRQALSVDGARRELLLRRGADSISVTLLLRPLL